jgi:hypothetical protein
MITNWSLGGWRLSSICSQSKEIYKTRCSANTSAMINSSQNSANSFQIQIPVVTRFNRPKQCSSLHIFPSCSFKIWRQPLKRHTLFGNIATFHLSWHVDSYNVGTWGRNKLCAITEDTQESKVHSSLGSIQTQSVLAWIFLNTLPLVSSTQTWRNSPNEKDHLSDW